MYYRLASSFGWVRVSPLCLAVTCAILTIPANSSAQQTRAVSTQPPTLSDAAHLLQAGRLAEAEAAVRAYLRNTARDTSGHTLLGVILDQRGRETEAEQSYNTALKLDPKNVAARTNLGVLLARTKRIEQAIEMFEAALRIDPTHAKASFNLGALYSARGEYARAIPLL